MDSRQTADYAIEKNPAQNRDRRKSRVLFGSTRSRSCRHVTIAGSGDIPKTPLPSPIVRSVPRPIWPIAIMCLTHMHQQLTERPVDLDPRETAEWIEALDQIVEGAGPDRA